MHKGDISECISVAKLISNFNLLSCVFNYRPISLGSTSGEIFKHIVSKGIRLFLAKCYVLNSTWRGFRELISSATRKVARLLGDSAVGCGG